MPEIIKIPVKIFEVFSDLIILYFAMTEQGDGTIAISKPLTTPFGSQ